MLSAVAQIWNEHFWVRSTESWTWLIPFSIRRVKPFASSVAGRRLTTGQHHRPGKILDFSCAPDGKFIKKSVANPSYSRRNPRVSLPTSKFLPACWSISLDFSRVFFENFVRVIFQRGQWMEICIRSYSRGLLRWRLESA
jgi:hypothetical protein